MTRICRDEQVVADRFRIVRFIAQGGMGEVYEAEDLMLGERVALKFLSKRTMGDPQIERRFRREVQLARKVTHPNVCRLHEVFQHRIKPANGGRATEVTFVAMEMLAGETLEDRLKGDGPFSEEATFELAVQMASALTAAHDADVIHRDFKTSNVMLVPRSGGERAVVTDFGLARLVTVDADADAQRLTGDVRMLGTPDTMAPEQLRGEDVGPQADVYAFGVVLFEMVTGKRPYEAENTMSLLVKRVSEEPRRPRSLVPSISERFETTILRCLERQPAARFETPTEVVASLSGVDPSVARGWTSSMPMPPMLLDHRSPAGSRVRAWLVPLAVGLAALAVIALWTLGGRRSGGSAGAPLTPVQLTTAAGLELDPAFSPNGETMVYACDETGSFELYLRTMAPGGTETQLTFGGTQAFEPTWSPDGRFVAYHSRAAGGIWRVRVSGGEPERLTTFGSRPAFSPDGERMVFQSESSPALSDTAAPAIARSELWVLDLDEGEPRPISRAGNPVGGHGAPAWSPDGRHIAFTASQRGRSEVWSLALETGEVTRLVISPGDASDPVYAPDGESIYFSARERQIGGLWRLAVSRRTGAPIGAPDQVVNIGLASIRQLAFDPRQRRAAYTALVTTSNLIDLPVDANGVPSGVERALTSGSGRSNRVSFAPNGKRLVYDHWRLGVDVDLWLMDLEAEQTRQLTTGRDSSSHPIWLDDGASIAYFAARDGVAGLWKFDLASAETALVTQLDSEVDWVRLSPDGTRVAYHARGSGASIDVWVQTLDSSPPRRLTAARELAGFPVWSHDGSLIAYQLKSGDDAHVMVMTADGEAQQQLTAGPGESWPFGFSPDGDKVVFAGQRGDGWNVWWVSRSTGEARRLTDLGRLGRYVRYPTWSPDGSRIIFELAETVGDIWLLEGLP